MGKMLDKSHSIHVVMPNNHTVELIVSLREDSGRNSYLKSDVHLVPQKHLSPPRQLGMIRDASGSTNDTHS
jgi:hypothetical protein